MTVISRKRIDISSIRERVSPTPLGWGILYSFPIFLYMSKLIVSTIIHAPIAKVWDALWNPVHIVHWGFADEATWHCPWAK